MSDCEPVYKCDPLPPECEPCDCNCDNECGDCEICNAAGKCVRDNNPPCCDAPCPDCQRRPPEAGCGCIDRDFDGSNSATLGYNRADSSGSVCERRTTTVGGLVSPCIVITGADWNAPEGVGGCNNNCALMDETCATRWVLTTSGYHSVTGASYKRIDSIGTGGAGWITKPG